MRAGFLGRLDVHQLRLRGAVGQNLRVHLVFNRADLRVRHRGVVGEVKARALGVHQAAFLLHMFAQHFAQRFVHQMCSAVVAHGGGAHRRIDLRLHRVAHFEATVRHAAVVAKHIGFDFLRVGYGEHRRTAAQRTLVAHLAAALGVKRGDIENDHTVLAGCEFLHWRAV